MSTNRLSQEAALELLRSCGVQGTETELLSLIDLCESDSQALEQVAAILCQRANGQADCVNEPEVRAAVIAELVRSNFPVLALRFYGKGYTEFGLIKAAFRGGLLMNSAFGEVGLYRFSESGTTENLNPVFFSIQHERALFLTDLGELKPAEMLLRELAFGQLINDNLDEQAKTFYRYTAYDYSTNRGWKHFYQYIARENLCDVMVLAGQLREAEHTVDGCIQAYESDVMIDNWSGSKSKFLINTLMRGESFSRLYSGSNPYARRAVARTLQGKVRQALADFKQAEAFHFRKAETDLRIKVDFELAEQESCTLTDQAAIYYALLLTRLGKLEKALKVLNYLNRAAKHRAARPKRPNEPNNEYPSLVVYTDLALSDIYRLKGEYELAGRYIEHPLRWAIETDQKEIYCWAHLSLARLKHALNQLAEAHNALNEAYSVATRHGFKLYEIDCLVTAGWIALSEQDLTTAEDKANAALKLVRDPDMAYAWGHGNILHLMGDILLRKGDLKQARLFLTGAAKLRESIEDPRFNNTQALLNNIME